MQYPLDKYTKVTVGPVVNAKECTNIYITQKINRQTFQVTFLMEHFI
jgi:hypothetical protein